MHINNVVSFIVSTLFYNLCKRSILWSYCVIYITYFSIDTCKTNIFLHFQSMHALFILFHRPLCWKLWCWHALINYLFLILQEIYFAHKYYVPKGFCWCNKSQTFLEKNGGWDGITKWTFKNLLIYVYMLSNANCIWFLMALHQCKLWFIW